jgi:hypothetical protein
MSENKSLPRALSYTEVADVIAVAREAFEFGKDFFRPVASRTVPPSRPIPLSRPVTRSY